MSRQNQNNKFAVYAGSSVLILAGLSYYNRKKLKAIVSGEANPKGNEAHLRTLNPRYQDLFRRFINAIQLRGYKVQINSSYRSFAKQAQEKAEDSRNATAGFSPHNYGIALDFQMSKDGKIYGKSTPKQDWINTGIPRLAASMGLKWGGDFAGYLDEVHFYVPLDTTRLYNLALKQFKTSDPNKIIGNRVNVA